MLPVPLLPKEVILGYGYEGKSERKREMRERNSKREEKLLFPMKYSLLQIRAKIFRIILIYHLLFHKKSISTLVETSANYCIFRAD
jgi:hypothetical protein